MRPGKDALYMPPLSVPPLTPTAQHNARASISFNMPVPTVPPFPDDVPTVPLLVIDYKLILERNEAEIDRLWEAATKLGFW